VGDAGWVDPQQHRLYLLYPRERGVAFRPLDLDGLVSEALDRETQSIQKSNIERVSVVAEPASELRRNFGEPAALAFIITEQRRIEYIDRHGIECRTI
jgi:hypothetical protein